MYPFVKWVGGKMQLIGEIRKRTPKDFSKYCEPFVGGGAVLFDMLERKGDSLKSVLINDINSRLITTYLAVRDNVDDLIELLQCLQKVFWERDKDGREEIYYDMRATFNGEDGPMDVAVTGALFIFLNKTGYNGLYRENKSGKFNVAMGNYKQPAICDEALLKEVSAGLQNVEIRSGDYKECLDYIDSDTFVYLDPPYKPTSTTANFNNYVGSEFCDEQQRELCEFCKRIVDEKGAKFLESNSDPIGGFFDNLYSRFVIDRVPVMRTVGMNNGSRGYVYELMISSSR